MKSDKNKGVTFIILSSIVIIPNIGCLIMAHFVMSSAPLILYIVPLVMITACIIGFTYGLYLRKKRNN